MIHEDDVRIRIQRSILLDYLETMKGRRNDCASFDGEEDAVNLVQVLFVVYEKNSR